MNLQQQVSNLLIQQIKNWELANQNYKALETILSRELTVGGIKISIQFNPARIQSTNATVSATAVNKRPCFLCSENRPKEQKYIPYNNKYLILVNPYPIFPKHFTIPYIIHSPQQIEHHLLDLLNIASELPDYILFYNGPQCGASAPDHMHFQAGNKGFLPLEKDWEIIKRQGKILVQTKSLTVFHLTQYPQAVFIAESNKKEEIISLFNYFTTLLPIDQSSKEIMVNLLCLFDNGIWRLYIMPRKAHRPTQYYNSQKLISPGAVDVSGIIITPRESDFIELTNQEAEDILKQVSITPETTHFICDQLIKI